MKLTPLDIRHKEFKRGMRGYVDKEVDEFLDEVADEFERLFKENIDLGERVEALQDKVDQYTNLEDTLQKTLISAQKSAEELKVNAEKEAQLILREAEMKARSMVNESYADKQSVEKSIVLLKGSEEEFRFKFRSLLEGYLKQLGEQEGEMRQREAEMASKAADEKAAIAREDTVAAPAPRPAEPDRGVEPVSRQAATGGRKGETRAAPAEAGRAAQRADDEAKKAAKPGKREAAERATLGEEDDLLADVDTEVGDDEFKW